jgi:hypothetical protein
LAEAGTPGALRRSGAVRSAIIAYGIAAYSWFVTRPDASVAMPMFLVGVAIQVLVLVAGVVAKRQGGEVAATALPIVELVADGITVLLFALATYQGILQRTASF